MGTIRLLLYDGNWSAVSLAEVERSGASTPCSEQPRDPIDENGANASTGPLDASDRGVVQLLEPAKFVVAVRPLYPHDQMLARTGGKVTLVFALDELGKPKDVHALDGSDSIRFSGAELSRNAHSVDRVIKPLRSTIRRATTLSHHRRRPISDSLGHCTHHLQTRMRARGV